MSLQIYVGLLNDVEGDEDLEDAQEALREINALLKRHSIDPQKEPTSGPEATSWTFEAPRDDLAGYVASAESMLRQGFFKLEGDTASHVLETSPGSAYYLPREFPRLLRGEHIHVGSSMRLQQFCESFSNALEIPDDPNIRDFGRFQSIDEVREAMEGWPEGAWSLRRTEAAVNLALAHAAQLSIRHKMIMVFG